MGFVTLVLFLSNDLSRLHGPQSNLSRGRLKSRRRRSLFLLEQQTLLLCFQPPVFAPEFFALVTILDGCKVLSRGKQETTS